MAVVVEMPKLGNTVEECILTAWRRQVGESVTAGEVLADIETDKTTFELAAPEDGVLLARFFEAGALIPVFTALCVVGSPGEDAEPYRPGRAQPAAGGGRAATSTPADQMNRAGDGAGHTADTSVLGSVRTGPDGPGKPARLSPRARRYRREHGIAVEATAGSGPGGRVQEADLRELSQIRWGEAQGGGTGVASSPPAPAGTGSPVIGAVAGAPPSEVEGAQLSRVRRTIATRLRESLTQTAQYTLHTSANAGSLLAVRRRLKSSPETSGISIGELVAYCTIRALLEVPGVNAELIDGVLHVHHQVHLAFACDTPRGLVVPVVRDSQDLSLGGLSQRFKQLAAQAVDGVIAADDLSGGTFTVSNLGSLGIEAFTPVLNPPQVAILGLNAIQVKPVRKEDGNLEFIDAIGLSLTVDHQVVDGAPAARFLRVARERIEEADSLCTI